MTENSPHYKLGYSLATIKALINAIESDEHDVIKQVQVDVAIKMAKKFVEENA